MMMTHIFCKFNSRTFKTLKLEYVRNDSCVCIMEPAFHKFAKSATIILFLIVHSLTHKFESLQEGKKSGEKKNFVTIG
jgi:hypothetical protein